MDYLDVTSENPEESLRLDEVLLDQCERRGQEFLRVWEPMAPCVVAGYSNRSLDEYEDIRKGYNLGANGYITKPFSSKELLNKMNLCLESV